MLVLGHAGLTLGSGILMSWISSRSHANRGHLSSEAPRGENSSRSLASFWGSMDYRLLMVGALLPDLIDKSLSTVLFGDLFVHGRASAHTLVWLAVISVAGLCLYIRKYRAWLLSLAFGTLMHMILDQMWVFPGIFFWPACGWTPTMRDYSVGGLLDDLFHRPATYIPEIVGAIILAAFVITLVRRHRVLAFVRTGQMSWADIRNGADRT